MRLDLLHSRLRSYRMRVYAKGKHAALTRELRGLLVGREIHTKTRNAWDEKYTPSDYNVGKCSKKFVLARVLVSLVFVLARRANTVLLELY